MPNLSGKMIRADPATSVFTQPAATSPMPLDTEDDTGEFVIGILLSREAMLGKRILGAVAYRTHAEIISKFLDVEPEAAKAIEISHAMFKTGLGYA
jgi:hypothetical protein